MPTNIRLSTKGLPGTNALAYYEKSLLVAVKKVLEDEHLRESTSRRSDTFGSYSKDIRQTDIRIMQERTFAEYNFEPKEGAT